MELTKDGRILVVMDSSVLINFLAIQRMDILKRLRNYAFRIPEHVRNEISKRGQKEVLDLAIQQGFIKEVKITDIEELQSYISYRARLGDGESACLAVGIHRKWVIASDEKKRVRSEIIRNLGEGYLLNTLGIIVKAIKEKVITVKEAEAIKEELAKRRFIINVKSFSDFLD